jgi:2-polyprenyl-6-methoxyphenol hydroxylase-like FAD-dependent oxidoreductase
VGDRIMLPIALLSQTAGSPMRILIVGGGIGGLTAAIALSRRKHKVTLIEKSPGFSPVGAGLILAPNAAHILRWLGVKPELCGQRVDLMKVVDAHGNSLLALDHEVLTQRYGATWSCARAELHEALVRALPTSVEVRLGTTLEHLEETAHGVSVSFLNAVEHFDVVVGADGIRSRVRALVDPQARLRYSGQTCYRGLVENPGLLNAVEAWGDDVRIGVVPMSQHRLYFYLVHRAAAQTKPLEFPTDFERIFGGLRGGIELLFSNLKHAPPLHHDLEELERPTWGRGRLFLLGDAAAERVSSC